MPYVEDLAPCDFTFSWDQIMHEDSLIANTGVKPVDVECISLIEEVRLREDCENGFWSLFSVKHVCDA